MIQFLVLFHQKSNLRMSHFLFSIYFKNGSRTAVTGHLPTGQLPSSFIPQIFTVWTFTPWTFTITGIYALDIYPPLTFTRKHLTVLLLSYYHHQQQHYHRNERIFIYYYYQYYCYCYHYYHQNYSLPIAYSFVQ